MGCETSSFHHERELMADLPKEKEEVKRHPNSARFHEILKELGELHERYLTLLEELKCLL